MKYNKHIIRFTARCLMCSMALQLLYPNVSLALTSGPTQPEVQSFEPVGTTDMVDLFTGDFNYNIPLLDVEGYPINIAYHAGPGMEQEASWVGLGWNINPGVINRSIRGVPDDFNGEKLTKELYIKNEKTVRLGVEAGLEVVGMGDPGAVSLSGSIGGNVTISNYRGVSTDFSFGSGVRLFNSVSAGVNIGVGSQSGADVDLYGGLNIATSQIISKDIAAGVGVSAGTGYNTRSGLKDIGITTYATVGVFNSSTQIGLESTTIPISMRNYVPVITNSSKMQSFYARLKVGGEFAWCNIWGGVKARVSKIEFSQDGSRQAYGYLYSQHATPEDIHDFTRDKDGMYNKSMKYLPMASMTYDVYAVSGQGTGGMFRPYRNDLGSVFDPNTKSSAGDFSAQVEASLGWLFGFGTDLSSTNTEISSGPWYDYKRDFINGTNAGSLYENVYFKQGGDITSTNQSYWSDLRSNNPIEANELALVSGSKSMREPRNNFIQFLRADSVINTDTAVTAGVFYDYRSKNGFADGLEDSITTITRNGAKRKAHHISQVVQTQTDGRRYFYGLPAYNNVQKEVTFTTEKTPDSKSIIGWESSENPDRKANGAGIDHYYSSTVTPAYVHSYFLTSVVSADYLDITGNGPSNDDIGSYNKFNYSLKASDYRWRSPSAPRTAQHNANYLSDSKDDKASYIIGSREQWALHSIESKNYVAEFFTSKRHDAMGVSDVIKNVSGYDNLPDADQQYSYKLDSIVLYNKHDRALNKAKATPIKTVIFNYDYSLCVGVPNTDSVNSGKLTLKKIYIKYGTSYKSMASPYQFEYYNDGYIYNSADKDRWGNYKPSTNGFKNWEFPYVDQADTNNNKYAQAWSLKKVKLPSGGVIEVKYEADDYAYVQDKPATEMVKIEGVGPSPYFTPMNQLYIDKKKPSLYIYFKRQLNRERSGDASEYFNGQDLLYYSMNVRLSSKYEQIKGYAQVEDVGFCDANYGWIRLKPVEPRGTKRKINPITFAALNTGRYNIPHILFPGSDPDQSALESIMSGMRQSFGELLKVGMNPIVKMVKDGWGRSVDPDRSYIRLSTPNANKKGGGYRVKQLLFHDTWDSMVGGDAQAASYGKNYNYKIADSDNPNATSSGVASYEPLVGGDENPLRRPLPYRVQNGSNFPPMDAVDLYQEAPIGESLYPQPVVGYSRVAVSSIHKQVGRSSQEIDVYRYFTARDYPIIVKSTAIATDGSRESYKLKKQENITKARQGYSIQLNDMHGKPKSIERFVRKVKGSNLNLEKVGYQIFKYSDDNVVKVLERSGAGILTTRNQLVGIEADVTVDTRQKIEHTRTSNFNANLNVTNVLFVPIPIPIGYPWNAEYDNEFYSVVSTKVIQRYGILMEVESFQDGALTKVKNEAFDATTGQPIVTSVNNEFMDKEYTYNYPAYWAYKSMGHAYGNTGFTQFFDRLRVLRNDYPKLVLNTGYTTNYNIGDEVLLSYVYGNNSRTIIGYVDGVATEQDIQEGCCSPIIRPKFLQAYGEWLSGYDSFYNIKIKVLRSGRRNMLTDVVQTFTTFKAPNTVNDNLDSLINITAKRYSDTTVIIDTFVNNQAKLLNSFANGTRGNYRLKEEYVYQANRVIPANKTMRKAGLFKATSAWGIVDEYQTDCRVSGSCYGERSPAKVLYLYNKINADNNWRVSRTITKWSPFVTEVENKDAIGNYSTAVYGHNEELPVAVAYNATQGRVLAESFEDYYTLRAASSLLKFIYSPFQTLFSENTVPGSPSYRVLNASVGNAQVTRGIAHTGNYSLKTGASSVTISLPAKATNLNMYSRFSVDSTKKYVLSYWLKPVYAPSDMVTSYSDSILLSSFSKKYSRSNIIDRWQQMTCEFTVSSYSPYQITLPANCYIDDLRIYPVESNIKTFTYNAFNERLMATLDENNYATFYEYDQEGNLVRTKKETERGIMTVSESRSANPKNQ